VQGIVSPCADISINYGGPDKASLTMHFSRVRGRPDQDVLLEFNGLIALRWESESFSLNPLPEPLPKCTEADWAGWTFPLLKVSNSLWLERYSARNPVAAERRVHYAFTAMNDLVQLLALPEVNARWISGVK